eukprot:SAG11_NODE_36335_length_262_cov_0.631902_1_plen_33_part_10
MLPNTPVDLSGFMQLKRGRLFFLFLLPGHLFLL